MKNLFFIATIFLGSLLVSCGGDTKTNDESNETRPRNNGQFLMYYYPTSSVYGSEFGKEFAKKDTCIGFPSYMTADEDGTLYGSVVGTEVSVIKSTDGGKTWVPVENLDTAKNPYASYVITAGKSKMLYALSSQGLFYISKDGGSNWEKKTSPCVKDTSHSSPGFGPEAWLAVSADGKKILAQAWYFEETVLAISEDEGNTWTAITPPTERNSSRGVGFCSDRIVYSSYDQIFYTDDNGKTWLNSTPDKLFSPKSESSYYGNRHFITDGDQFVLGVEVPSAASSRSEKNQYPGAIFLSKDGGKTFETLPFPYNIDPTPNTSDEYVYLTFLSKKLK